MTRLALMMIVTAALAGGCGKDQGGGGKPAPAKTALLGAGEQTATGERRIPVDVGKSGYGPSRIEARAGERLILAFTRTADTECGSQVRVADGAVVDLPLDKTVEIPLVAPQDGELRFVCGMDMMSGTVFVAK